MNDPSALFVATNGNDAWSGALPESNAERTDGPLATLAVARDVVRRRRAAGTWAASAVVEIRGGRYFLDETLVLTPEDSPTEADTLCFRAVDGEDVVLSGGRVIGGWAANDDGTWSAELPDVKAGTWPFRQLWVNGERRSRPRVPAEGVLPLTAQDPDDEDAPENHTAFRFQPGDLRGDWRNLADVEIVVRQFWTHSRLRIDRIDDAENVVHFTGGGWRPLNWSTGYWAENVAEALRPGQWYLDRPAGILIYMPLPDENVRELEFVAPLLACLVRVEGSGAAAREVRACFEGLAFHHTTWPLPTKGYSVAQADTHAPAAVRAVALADGRFGRCEFAHLGGWAVEFGAGCRDSRVDACRFFDLGAGGVRIGSDSRGAIDAPVACGITVADSDFRDGARVFLGAPAVWIGHSHGNRIRHNEIQGPFHWAVSVGWQWDYWPPNPSRGNLIEYNHCHHIGSDELGSHGVLYALGVQPGTVFRNNLVHDVRTWPELPEVASGMGIVLDNGCVGMTVEDNVVCRCEGPSFCVNFNVIGDVVQNNIFACGLGNQLNRYGDPTPADETMPNPILFRQNIVYWDTGRLFHETEWPNFATLWDYNLYWCTAGEFTFLDLDLAAWRKKGLDRHSVMADPLFADAATGDFALPESSPALALGFRPIDLSTVGPRR